eukprot:9151826-Pyramimonas_sp.AAC.1
MDTAARRAGIVHADAHPIFLSFDIKAAFPSMSQTWLRLVLERHRMHIGFFYAINALAAGALSHLSVGSEVVPMFDITSGVPQGCPLSGSLWALGFDPLLRHLVRPFPSKEDASLGACADDVGVVLNDIMLMPRLSNTFQHAKKLAGLLLQTAKCVVVPLAVECTEAEITRYAAIISNLVPEWSDVKIAGYAKYLG